MNEEEIREINLAAPCGFYCGTCRHYLARTKGLLTEKRLKHGCGGCRIQNKRCSWVKRDCVLLGKRLVAFCFECDEFPCDNLRKLDERHHRDYGVSDFDNLRRIREIGAREWLREQSEKWMCPECGGNLCVMDGVCYDCGYVMDRL